MMHLQNIIKEDRIHFDGLKGAARTPAVVTDLFDPELILMLMDTLIN
ncbi:hypothetical protein ABNG30_16990 [Bacillus thuringiensis]